MTYIEPRHQSVGAKDLAEELDRHLHNNLVRPQGVVSVDPRVHVWSQPRMFAHNDRLRANARGKQLVDH